MRPDFGGADGDRGRWWRLGGAIAAVLILGIAIGRMTVKTPPPGTVAETPVAAGDSVPASAGRDRGAEIYRLAATDLFNSADLRLTDFRARSCGPDEGHEGLSWAAGMLLQTRLLMDTPVADDPTLRPLLDDLELVLAQIIGLSRDDCARDMAFITEGLHKRATLDRLRLAAADGRRHPL